MPILLIVLSALTTTVLLATLLGSGRRTTSHTRTTHVVGVDGPVRQERICGRILFVERREDELLLDCVASLAHPALSCLPPGTPFALAVEPAGPAWFGEAVESMVLRWAEEDAPVEFLVVAGPDGERVDVRGDKALVRFRVNTG